MVKTRKTKIVRKPLEIGIGYFLQKLKNIILAIRWHKNIQGVPFENVEKNDFEKSRFWNLIMNTLYKIHKHY